jgi:adenylylsulfate kinase
LGKRVVALDGDDLRSGLCSDLGFTSDDRRENIRRAAHVAHLLSRNGNIVVASFITPKEEFRTLARGIVGSEHFIGVYLRCSYQTCAKRDVKGLYGKADSNQIQNFTGKDSAFEEPGECELVIETTSQPKEESLDCITQKVLPYLQLTGS